MRCNDRTPRTIVLPSPGKPAANGILASVGDRMSVNTSAAEILRLLELESRLAKRSKIDAYYPETGNLRRELYPK
jgi:hypothetical protein